MEKYRTLLFFLLIIPLVGKSRVLAHHGHDSTTYEVTPVGLRNVDAPHLLLKVTDSETELGLASRFILEINAIPYVPESLGENGLRFVSIHKGKRQRFIATYTRGNGEVFIQLPQDAKTGSVTVSKGFEYLSQSIPLKFDKHIATAHVKLHRWIDLQSEGWHSSDAHLHYERTDPKHNSDWLTILDADGLSHAHFLVLKGGNVPGVWANQYEFGSQGEVIDGSRFIRSGEEYRDSTQGHINLLGIQEVIQPISTGGIGSSRILYNYPPLLDILNQAKKQGGMGGPAHGGSNARSSTSSLDTVLGAVDFFEIANSHLLKTDVWYLLLNCGFIVPPTAGTDLPNFAFRDSWQPFFGEIRTYVHTGKEIGFNGWSQAVKRGNVFITSGPIIQFEVDDVQMGGVVHLPAGGGEVSIKSNLSSPRPLEALEIIRMGKSISIKTDSTKIDRIHHLQLNQKLFVDSSCWLAVRGRGGPKKAIEKGLKIKQAEIAHSGIIQIIVGNLPIKSKPDIEKLREQLISQQEYYRTMGKYEKNTHRIRFVELFQKAIEQLE